MGETKNMHILSKEDFLEFINSLIADNSLNVVGVKSKGTKFAFGPLESADQLRLDYDVTLLPPKKYFFPQRETLVTYDVASGYQNKSLADTKPNIIVGVHPYDIMAILHMDEIFRETKSDPNYLARRNSSVIIGVNIQNMSESCFASSMGCATIDYGYDLMLTDLGNKYAIDVGSHKGADLLNKYSKNVKKALASDIHSVGKKKQEIMNKTQQEFSFSSELIPEMLGKFYEKTNFWEDHSEECLSADLVF